MQTIRKRIKSSDYKEVERDGDMTIVRWDATPEIVTVPSKKKGGEETTKETGYVICSERVYLKPVTKKKVQEDIDKDLALRYPNGDAPKIKAKL